MELLKAFVTILADQGPLDNSLAQVRQKVTGLKGTATITANTVQADNALAAIHAKVGYLSESGGERGLLDKILFGREGREEFGHIVEHSISHAILGSASRAFMMGGGVALGLDYGIEAFKSLAESLSSSGDSAERAAEAMDRVAHEMREMQSASMAGGKESAEFSKKVAEIFSGVHVPPFEEKLRALGLGSSGEELNNAMEGFKKRRDEEQKDIWKMKGLDEHGNMRAPGEAQTDEDADIARRVKEYQTTGFNPAQVDRDLKANPASKDEMDAFQRAVGGPGYWSRVRSSPTDQNVLGYSSLLGVPSESVEGWTDADKAKFMAFRKAREARESELNQHQSNVNAAQKQIDSLTGQVDALGKDPRFKAAMEHVREPGRTQIGSLDDYAHKFIEAGNPKQQQEDERQKEILQILKEFHDKFIKQGDGKPAGTAVK